MIEENHEKTPVRLVGTGIWTRDLPNASLVRYHGATSLDNQGPLYTRNEEKSALFRRQESNPSHSIRRQAPYCLTS